MIGLNDSTLTYIMPFHLVSFTGGLGNQLFQLVTLYTLAKKYSTTFSVNEEHREFSSPFFNDKIPVYLSTVFESFLETSEYKSLELNRCGVACNVLQHAIVPTFDTIDCKDMLVYINGLSMHLKNFYDEYTSLQKLFYAQKQKLGYELTNLHSRLQICIACRTFSQEKHTEWGVSDEYYVHALSLLLSIVECTDIELCIFTDDSTIENILLPKLLRINSNINIEYSIHVGKRDNTTDVLHFFQMFDCDHYILCNSTFHYWAALFSKFNSDKKVFYPSHTKDGKNTNWFRLICPDSWISI